MILHVKKAKYLHDYVLWVRFSDGAEGEVDLANELDGEVFEPLKDVALFKAFRVDSELETIVWPNEADLAPEFLREKLVSADEHGSARERQAVSRVAESPVPYRTKRSGTSRQPKA